jgi:hypothetical protein
MEESVEHGGDGGGVARLAPTKEGWEDEPGAFRRFWPQVGAVCVLVVRSTGATISAKTRIWRGVRP